MSLKSSLEQSVSYFFFLFSLRPFDDYFSSYETGQSVGGLKMGEPPRSTPRKNTWHTCKQNLACLTCGQNGAGTHTRHSGEMINDEETALFNRSASGDASQSVKPHTFSSGLQFAIYASIKLWHPSMPK